MHPHPSLSNVILGGAVAAVLAAGVAAPTGLMPPDQRPQGVVDSDFSQLPASTYVNRSRKGDRLPVTPVAPVTDRPIMLHNPGSPEHRIRGATSVPEPLKTLEIEKRKRAPKLVPASPLDCEARGNAVSNSTPGGSARSCLVG